MQPSERVHLAYSQLDQASYYDILSVEPGVDRSVLQRAFHRFALAYHPDRHVDEAEDVREKARRVFQRGVEAYSVLREPKSAAIYARCMALGRKRLTADELELLSRPAPAPKPQAPPKRQSGSPFVDAMESDDGREVAERVERLVAEGRLTEAYQQLGLLELMEPGNAMVTKRLKQLSDRVKKRP